MWPTKFDSPESHDQNIKLPKKVTEIMGTLLKIII